VSDKARVNYWAQAKAAHEMRMRLPEELRVDSYHEVALGEEMTEFSRSREVDEEIWHVHNCPGCEWNWRHHNEECEARGAGVTDWPCPGCEGMERAEGRA